MLPFVSLHFRLKTSIVTQNELGQFICKNLDFICQALSGEILIGQRGCGAPLILLSFPPLLCGNPDRTNSQMDPRLTLRG